MKMPSDLCVWRHFNSFFDSCFLIKPLSVLASRLTCCYQMYKEQKLKANHNTKHEDRKLLMLLSNVQRTKVESKSQLVGIVGNQVVSCYQMYKEQKLKANHNVYTFTIRSTFVVIKCTKNKSWKQITTDATSWVYAPTLLSNVQRTKVESKSQLLLLRLFLRLCCYQMYKEQKLKANHNQKHGFLPRSSVVIKCTKNKSWKQITTNPIKF